MKTVLKLILVIGIGSYSQLIFSQNSGIDRAVELMNAEDYESAGKVIDSLLKKNPKQSRMHCLKYQHLCATGKLLDAGAFMKKAIKKMPDSADLYNTRGVYLDRLGMYKYALEDFQKTLELAQTAQDKSAAMMNVGGQLSKLRDFEGAYKILKQAVQLDSTNVGAWNNLSVTCDELKREEEGMNCLLQVIKIDSTFIAGYVNLGFRYQNLGEYAKSIEYFNKALSLSPNEPLAYSNRSYSRYKLNDLAGALMDINKSIELFPMNSWAYKIRALIKFKLENKAEGCEDLATAKGLGYTAQYGSEVDDLIKVHCR